MELEPDNPYTRSAADDPPYTREAEREQQRRTYWVCQFGFGILAVALILASFTSVVGLLSLLGNRALAVWFLRFPWWNWLGTPITLGALLGSFLLWGRWNHPGWQRRAGLLIAMNGVDAVLWFLQHGSDLGVSDGGWGHEWLREQLGAALGWAEFTLIARLACDLLAHLGADQAPNAGRSTRALAATGGAVWLILFLDRTDWRSGWPLLGMPPRSWEMFLLYVGSVMIWTITLIQVTALCIAATRQTALALTEMDREDKHHDLFRSRSERDAS